MVTIHSVSRYLGLALLGCLATASCGGDDDSSSTTGGSSGKGGTSSNGGKIGAGGTASPSAGVPGTPGEGGTAAVGPGAGGTGMVETPEVIRTDLVSDEGAGGAGGAAPAAPAANVDPNLINAWGMSFDPDPAEDTAFWVSAADSGVSTIYAPDGTPQPLVVKIPAAMPAGMGSPTGQVYNPTTGFKGDKFIFASEDGVISGWKAGATAVSRADRSADDASYKGLTLIEGAAPLLVAANFRAGTLDVFDDAYKLVAAPMFVDPKPVASYVPFNVAALGDKVYVAYAKQNAAKDEEVAGVGNGYVNSFNPDGSFDAHLIAKGALNAPWGMALAPAGFTPAPGELLVGNFGDGMIHGYDASTGELMAVLSDAGGNPIMIDGLWALAFGPKKDAEDLSEQLFFTAGPEEETHGLFGVLTAP